MDLRPLTTDDLQTGTKRRGAGKRKGNPVKLSSKKEAIRFVNSVDKRARIRMVDWVSDVDRQPCQPVLTEKSAVQQGDFEYATQIHPKSVPACLQSSYEDTELLVKNQDNGARDLGDSKPYVCKRCDKSYSNKGSYRRHLRISCCSTEQSYTCTHCSFATSRKSTWLQHLAEIHHVDPDGTQLQLDVKCPNCDFVCVTKPRLMSHVRRKHTTDKPHKCAECVYSSITKCDLEKHIRIVHRNERPYMCETCGFCSKTVSGFNSHMRSHAGIRPFRCGLCDKAFSRGARLRIHQQKHADAVKPYVCHLCGYACRRRDNLLVHLRRVHKEDTSVM